MKWCEITETANQLVLSLAEQKTVAQCLRDLRIQYPRGLVDLGHFGIKRISTRQLRDLNLEDCASSTKWSSVKSLFTLNDHVHVDILSESVQKWLTTPPSEAAIYKNSFLLLDGNHRAVVNILAGRSTIPVTVTAIHRSQII